jgi:hypothetical protein
VSNDEIIRRHNEVRDQIDCLTAKMHRYRDMLAERILASHDGKFGSVRKYIVASCTVKKHTRSFFKAMRITRKQHHE